MATPAPGQLNINNPPAQLIHLQARRPTSTPPPAQPNIGQITGSLTTLATEIGRIPNVPQLVGGVANYNQLVTDVNVAIAAINALSRTANDLINTVTATHQAVAALTTR